MKYIIAIDIGGSTFKTGLFSNCLNAIDISKQDKIRYYSDKNTVLDAIVEQVNSLIVKNNIKKNNILGVGIALPGPLDTENGIILNTPNLTIFQNCNIVNELSRMLGFNIFIENDANLFTLGEWYSNYQDNNIVLGVTLGTGLGLGLVVNGVLFKGGNGHAMEYGISPFIWGECEKNVCINFIKQRAKDLYGEVISPIKIEEYYKANDKNAIKIYNEFGSNLGIVLSHIVNMVDPNIIVLGGGLSKAYDCFRESMFLSIEKHSLTFSIDNTRIIQSKLREKSAMVGACNLVKEKVS